MATAASEPCVSGDMDVVDDLYELQTLHRGSRLVVESASKWNNSPHNNRMATAAAKREKKPQLSFKERFFGGKKNRKGTEIIA